MKPIFETWLAEVLRQAINAGVTIDTEAFNDVLVYLHHINEEPGNAVKRYVDTRIRCNAIREADHV